MTNMWSVKTVPNDSSLSFGFGFFTLARLILIGSLMFCPLVRRRGASSCSPPGRIRARRSGGDPPADFSENDGLTIEPKGLAIHVGDLAQAHVILHRVDQHGHHVVATAARVGQLLEPALDLPQVAGGLEALDALDLVVLDRGVDLEV